MLTTLPAASKSRMIPGISSPLSSISVSLSMMRIASTSGSYLIFMGGSNILDLADAIDGLVET